MEQTEKTMNTAQLEEQSNPEIFRAKKKEKELEGMASKFNAEDFTEEVLEHKYLNIGISKRHLRASVENIPKSILDDLKGFFKKESYYIHGEVGSGKTYLVSALLKEYIKNDKYEVRLSTKSDLNYLARVSLKTPTSPRFISLPDLLLKIRLAFKDGSQFTEEDIITEFTDEEFLVLDDIGVEKPSEWVLQTLYTIIDRRNRDLKQTIFTSNYAIAGLKDRLGERIVSRIVELCGKNNILHLKGKDRRLQ